MSRRARLKTLIRHHRILSAVVVTALLVGTTVYGWQYWARRSLVSSDAALKAKIAQQDKQLHPASHQPSLKDQDALTRLAQADYLAVPTNKTAAKIKVDKVVGNFGLLTVTSGSDSYKVIAKRVLAQWVIIIKSKTPPDYELKRFQVPAKLFES